MERKYYRDIGYKPFLFYVVFGVSAEELEVSRTRWPLPCTRRSSGRSGSLTKKSTRKTMW